MSVTFRIKASEAHGRRLDPSFYSPQYKQLDEALASCCYDCYEIRDLRIEVFQGVSRNLLENDRIRLLKVKIYYQTVQLISGTPSQSRMFR